MPNWFRWLPIFVATLLMCACRTPLTVLDDGSGRPLPPMVPGNLAKVADGRLIHGGPSQAAKSLRRVRNTVSGVSNLDSVEQVAAQMPSRADVGAVARISDIDGETFQDVNVTDDGEAVPVPSSTAGELRALFLARQSSADANASALADELQAASAQATQMAATQRITDLDSPFLDDDPAPLIDLDTPSIDFTPGMDVTPIVPDQDAPIEYIYESDGSYSPVPGYESAPMAEYPIIDVPDINGELIEGWPANVYPDVSCLPQAPCAVPESTQLDRPLEPWRIYHDEYICDGGDANSSVSVRGDWSLRNLDPEDTVGHFDALDGRVVVEPSNRVCIYAPRFAATRKVTALYQSENRLMPLTADEQLVAVTENRRQATDQFSQNVEAQRHLLVQPTSEFRDRLPATIAAQNVGLLVLDRDLSAHEDFRVIKFGVHKQTEKARLTEFVEKAITWSRDTTVQVILDEKAARTGNSVKGVEELFALAEQGSPKLRVIKTASVEDALPGEEVEFTLRFDNVGHQVIGNVTIIDNLSARLEYIKDSAFCTTDAELITTVNDEESLTLRWEIAEPLKVGDGGLIRFKCRVR